MNDIIENAILPAFCIMGILVICISIVKKWDNDTIEKIDNLVNKNNLEVYENCWKLEQKYYCKKEND